MVYEWTFDIFKLYIGIYKFDSGQNSWGYIRIKEHEQYYVGWFLNQSVLWFRNAQWIFLLYRRLQKIEQVKPDHCDRYQNNRNKNCNWMALVSYIGNCGNISQISLKCRKSLNLVKLLKSWQFIISLKTFGDLIIYYK